MRRPTAEKRHLDYKKAIKKRKIVLEVYRENDWYNNLHQYSKNKVFCSCPLCAVKTNNRGKRGAFWASSENWKISDRRKLDELEYQEDEELTLE